LTKPKRKSWTEEETKILIEYWDSIGSITLFSLLLKRSASSIQTQASRIGLPRRNEKLQKHRRRWQEDDEILLNKVLDEETDNVGRIRIDKVAKKIDRTIDAVIAKLIDEYYDEETLLNKIHIPDSAFERLLKKDPEVKKEHQIDPRTGRPKIEDKRRTSKMRTCLMCQKPFWSDGAHNRVCDKCKKSQDGDDWYGGY
jgi:hypothetical protein